jgi:nitrate reductase delta subunit
VTVAGAELFDALAAVVDYPHGDLHSRVRAGLAELSAVNPAAAAELERFAAEVAGMSIGELQEQYTATFDLDPACALDTGWHLFGDAHQRGAFMAALREELERAGVRDTAQLPDHLTSVLRLVGREHPVSASGLAALIAPAIDTVHRALARRQSPYVHVLAAIRAVLAGVEADVHQEVIGP